DQDGLTIPRATTIYDAAHLLFVKKLNKPNPIPVLCHREHMRPAAVCRICVVEIYNQSKKRRERKLLPACQHPVDNDMEIHTIESPDLAARDRVRSAVKVLLELLLADHFDPRRPNDQAPYNELWALAQRLKIGSSRMS